MEKNISPTFEQLVDWLEGRLSSQEARLVVEQMAAADPETQADLAWLQEFYFATRLVREVEVVELPPAVSQRLIKQFAAYAHLRRQPSLFQQLTAQLSFDSRLAVARGIRAASSADSLRQLVYETGLATLALTLYKRNQDQLLDLFGQLLPIQETEADLVHVALFQGQSEFDSTITDDLGEFTLKALPTDQYSLILTGDQFEIKIAPLDLSI